MVASLGWRINADHIIDHPENVQRLPAKFQNLEHKVDVSLMIYRQDNIYQGRTCLS